jgi:Ca-activated chloride channel family protein
MVGRYKRTCAAKITITGKVGEESVQLDFGGELAKSSRDEKYAFVEKLWAMRRIGEIIDELDLHGQNQELVDELIALSTKHGILTPYTSFLADENAAVNLADARWGRERTRSQLLRLAEAEGRAGVAQRAAKQAYRSFGAAPLPGAGGGGFGGAEAAAPTPALGLAAGQPLQNAARYLDIDRDKEVVATNVLNVGKETLYKRGELWIASNAREIDIAQEADRKKVTEVERFSDAYFQLVTDNSASENAVFALQKEDEQLLIQLRGKYYLIK